MKVAISADREQRDPLAMSDTARIRVLTVSEWPMSFVCLMNRRLRKRSHVENDLDGSGDIDVEMFDDTRTYCRDRWIHFLRFYAAAERQSRLCAFLHAGSK